MLTALRKINATVDANFTCLL